MGIVRGLIEMLSEKRRCPKCKVYSPEEFSIGSGKPYKKLGYCDELGLFILRCPKCGALRYKDSLKQKQ
jgi:rubredoxin